MYHSMMHRLELIAACATSVCWGTAARFTRIAAGLNRAAHNARNAARLCHRNLTSHALGACDCTSLADLTANRIRHFASAGLLCHGTGRIRNLP